MNFTSCAEAAAAGDIKAILVLRRGGAEWSESACTEAADGGHLLTLQWLRSQVPPCPWNFQVGHAAVRRNDLVMLRWLDAQRPRYLWEAIHCDGAAAWGHIETLQWLRALNPPCPWDGHICATAANYGQLAVLHWLYAEGAPYDRPKYIHPDCADFMAVEGAMWALGIYAHSTVKPAKNE